MTSKNPRPAGSVILTRQEDVWVLALEGEHDLATVHLLEDQMQRIGVSGAKVVIDATPATFIDCRVICWLLRWSQRSRHSGQLDLAVATGHSGSIANRLLTLLNRLNLAETIPTVATTAEALDALLKPAQPIEMHSANARRHARMPVDVPAVVGDGLRLLPALPRIST